MIFYVPPAVLMVCIAVLSLAKGTFPPNLWTCLGTAALCVAALEWLLARRSKD